MMLSPEAVETDERQCFLVLGMHRSGTSAFAGLISKLGINLPDTPMMPEMPSNPHGHFEPSVVVDLHEALLEKLDSGWTDPRKLDLSTDESGAIAEFESELGQFVSSVLASDRRIVLKDPRTCRLLPTWRKVLERADCKTIPLLIVRNPIGVSDSLAARNKLPPGVSVALWLRHVLDAEAGTRGLPRSFVRFESLADDWQNNIDRISDQTGTGFGSQSRPGSASSFVDRSAIHHVHEDSEIIGSSEFPDQLADLATEVISAHNLLVTDPADRSAIQSLDQATSEFDAFTASYGKMIFRFTEQIFGMESDLTEIRAESRSRANDIEHLKGTLSWRITAPLRLERKIRRALTGSAA